MRLLPLAAPSGPPQRLKTAAAIRTARSRCRTPRSHTTAQRASAGGYTTAAPRSRAPPRPSSPLAPCDPPPARKCMSQRPRHSTGPDRGAGARRITSVTPVSLDRD